MKDLDFRGNILSGTKYRASPEVVSLMDETNNLAKNLLERFFAQAPPGASLMDETSNQVGRSSADKFAWSKFA